MDQSSGQTVLRFVGQTHAPKNTLLSFTSDRWIGSLAATALVGAMMLASMLGCAPPPSFDSTDDRTDAVLSFPPVGIKSHASLQQSRLGNPLAANGDTASKEDETVLPIGLRLARVTQLVQVRRDGTETIPAGRAKKDNPASDRGELIPTPQGVPETKAGKSESAPAVPSGQTPIQQVPGQNAAGSTGTVEIPEEAQADGPEDYQTWETPAVALVLTGNQHGYIEPCGCTGLDRQKGGVARRYSFLQSLREKQWPVVPFDVGNQVRRVGKQAAIKLQQSVRALEEMEYRAVGFGPDDVRLPSGELLSVAAMEETPDDTMYVSANVILFDPELMPQWRVVEQAGMKIGVTSILDPRSLEIPASDDLTINEIVPAARDAIEKLSGQQADFNVLLFYGEEDRAKQLVSEVAGFHLIVVAGGYGEPTYRPTAIENSQTQMITTGAKGMYAGIIGLYPTSQVEPEKNASPQMRYARVALSHEFTDAPEMRGLMKDYQDQLRDIGLTGLGIESVRHSTGRKFAGTATCGRCHTEAMEVWEGSAHAHATESIVMPPRERGDIARHFDPECISCHVTGWNPQEYYPYQSGYLSLETTAHLKGNGCENCHGPGAEHAAAEEKGSTVTQAVRDELRIGMRLTLEKAREKCITCHDLDNSPDFHQPDAFEEIYWPEVEHYGLD